MVMTIQEIFDLAIKMGIEADPRGKKFVEKQLSKEKESYKKLDKEEKEDFDQERLSNPYLDSGIHYGDPKTKVKTVLVGIDVETEEILLADYLNRFYNRKINVVIGHHPASKTFANLAETMSLQNDLMAKFGVPINVAEKMMEKRIAEVSRGIHPINHYRESDAAALLNMPFANIHTPADNLVHKFLEDFVEKNKGKWDTVGELKKAVEDIPEYKEAKKRSAGPKIFCGSEGSRLGKIAATEITGGTSGPKEIYERLSQSGVGTILSMHLSEEWKKEAEKYHLNVLVLGHIASDSVGMNLFLDKLEAKEINIIPFSGLIRISRNKKK